MSNADSATISMIDGLAMCCDFADLKIVEIDDEEEN